MTTVKCFSWSRLAVLAVLPALVAACGASGGSQKPMVADPAASSGGESSELSALSGPAADGGVSPSSDLSPLPADPSTETEGMPASLQPTASSANEEGARTLLLQFVAPNADHVALTGSLRPTSEDYKAMFDAKTATKVEASQAKEWNSHKAVLKPKKGQTEVKLWSATGTELAQGTGPAKDFPADYKKIGKHLNASLLFYRFKFVEPGKDTGTAYDGLTYVNNHWVIAPKSWRALESKDTKEEEEKPAAASSKKPKGKGKGKKR